MLDNKLHSGDTILSRLTNEYWLCVMIDEECNQAIISCKPYGYRVVNIKGLEIDYILPNGE